MALVAAVATPVFSNAKDLVAEEAFPGHLYGGVRVYGFF